MRSQTMGDPRSFDSDFSFSRRYLRHMKGIVGANLIGEAPEEEDRHRNTDLIVLRLETIRVACRARQHHYLADYRDEFTIRQSRPSGVDSELLKIMKGWGDYLLYGFAADTGDRLCAWMLGDLRVFREWYYRYMKDHNGDEPGERRVNGDGSSAFRAFKIVDLPTSFIVERHVPNGGKA